MFLKNTFSSIAWDIEINTEELFMNVSLPDLLSKNPDDSPLKTSDLPAQLEEKDERKQKPWLSSSFPQSPQSFPAVKEPHHMPVSDILIYAACVQ